MLCLLGCILGKYCGHSKPKPIVTLGNSLWVYLDTNEVNPDKGFRAMYKTVAPEAVTGKRAVRKWIPVMQCRYVPYRKRSQIDK